MCVIGQIPNENRTGCDSKFHLCSIKILWESQLLLFSVIHPPIALVETVYTEKNTSSVDIQGKARIYTVDAGVPFGIECNSVETLDNEFVGRITWYKNVTNSSGL